MDERKIARDSVFKLVFEYIFQKTYNEKSLEVFCSENISVELKDYIRDCYKGIIGHYDELVLTIKELSKNFSIDRVFKLDLAILMLAMYEMKYIKEIPNSVSINEAVEISKQYSTEKSYKYINGILSTFNKVLTGEKVVGAE